MPEKIEILLAVNEIGDGWVMGWDGDRDGTGEYALSPYYAFAEDVLCNGREAESVGVIPHPNTQGVHRFRGTISWKPNREGTAFQLNGEWETLYTVPPSD